MDKNAIIVVTGAGGFIGGHLVKRLCETGHTCINAVDIKPIKNWCQAFPVNNIVGDLKDIRRCHDVCRDVDYVFNLAADMGGMGFIENNKAACMLSVLINTHMLMASRANHIKRYFFSSSACVYAANKQTSLIEAVPLKEEDAYPANAEDGYGWEKLFSERMCRHFTEDYHLDTRVVRFHNVYGPHGTWEGGREKAPAAICRKVIEAIDKGTHHISIWGNGAQLRSFMYIDDCIDGIMKIMDNDIREPVNLGSAECVSIDKLVTLVEEIADVKLTREYELDAPRGVNGRSSDNTKLRGYLNWEPKIPLHAGLEKTYAWIRNEYDKKHGLR